MAKLTPPPKSANPAAVTAAPKPRARTLRNRPTAKDLERFANAPTVASRRRARLTRLLREVAEVAVQFEPVADDHRPLDVEAIERHLWTALTALTEIRPQVER